MRITLRQLQIFRAIAVSGSTIAAAGSMPLSQSATSAALNELERVLGARLFDRVGKRLLLNDNGRALLPPALAVLDGAKSIEAAFVSGDPAFLVDLRLFASTTVGNYVLPRLLARFRAEVPAAGLDVRIGNTLDAVTAVRDFSADLGLVEGPCHASDVVTVPWLEDELVIVAARAHPLAKAARRKRLSAEQLGRAHWLLREPGSGTREAVEHALLPHLRLGQPAMTLGSSEAIKNSVAAGMGVSCLSRSVVQDLVAAKRLTVLATELPRLSRRFTLIYHQRKVLSQSLRRFIAHCENYGVTL
ncbi:MAG: LysR family transcriptional regulator [Steroidobacteraceae bacterium]|jgi:DNA-binding transcriptional LysR family regulator